MAHYLAIHPDNPQPRIIKQAVDIIRKGGVIVYPTESCFALGCHLGDKDALERIRRIRQVDDKHHFTLVCRDLSELATYAKVDNRQYRYLKSAMPGAYTVILQATREVPRRVAHAKRATIGLRVPNNVVAQALLEELGEPLLSSTLLLPGEEWPPTDGWEISERLEHEVDAVLDAGLCGTAVTTVIDLTDADPVLIRPGAGDLAVFGLSE
ncbi:L-threonylcarbamoyladenylate synthase [Chitinimonas taiwanensis]|uniref:tRNA threonylcarbamoyl adenosine modification protein, Sua5/YciO/YrdC/YwlC family n=1 Tax=Chitinimonas taiwanensis DSM 18899 TaxID=1121279 RepID=A0A1K2HQ18_9NEIS|nr:L-threonylcarbamoyladenylate synthase [Chitinimonas taiwanensis]SFZ78904.1 tRNA threonylcarbamoyl adenosine modification protein, Sua5/YciO/YrdC/YwlC family [Chitinimonas taiwanensis DSM 18899]